MSTSPHLDTGPDNHDEGADGVGVLPANYDEVAGGFGGETGSSLGGEVAEGVGWIPGWEVIRQLVAAALFCWAIFVNWMPGRPGTTLWIQLPLLVAIALCALSLWATHPDRSTRLGRKVRLALLLPVAAAVATCVVLDILELTEGIGIQRGLSAGVFLAVFGLGLVLGPNGPELANARDQERTLVRWRRASALTVLCGLFIYLLTSLGQLAFGQDPKAQHIGMVRIWSVPESILAVALYLVTFGLMAVHMLRGRHYAQPVQIGVAGGWLLLLAISGSESDARAIVEAQAHRFGIWIILFGASLAALPRLGRSTQIGATGSSYWIRLAGAAVAVIAAYQLVYAIGAGLILIISFPSISDISALLVISILLKLLVGATALLACMRLHKNPGFGRPLVFLAMLLTMVTLFIDTYLRADTTHIAWWAPRSLILLVPVLMAIWALTVPSAIRADYGYIVRRG